MAAKQPLTLVHVVTVPLSLRFFHGQIGFMQKQGFAIHVVSSPGDLLDRFAAEQGVTAHAVEMSRSISPLRDLVALWRIWRTLRRIRPNIVHTHTPKASLLGMISAWLARVPVRIYHIRGLLYPYRQGVKQRLLYRIERLSCGLAHRVFCNSQSNLTTLLQDGVCLPEKISILHHGSGNGVDAMHLFNPKNRVNKQALRDQYGISAEALVIGFVGRIVRDKGITELAEAWQSLRTAYSEVHLLLVGPFEKRNAILPETRALLLGEERIHLTGLVEAKDEMPSLYSIMDIVVLPSYREGFPNVPLEGAAMSLPVVSTQAEGCVDAVVDGVTGTLVPVRDGEALVTALRRYLDDPDLRRKHGQAGRERVLRDFCPEDIWQAQLDEYHRLLAEKGLLME